MGRSRGPEHGTRAGAPPPPPLPPSLPPSPSLSLPPSLPPSLTLSLTHFLVYKQTRSLRQSSFHSPSLPPSLPPSLDSFYAVHLSPTAFFQPTTPCPQSCTGEPIIGGVLVRQRCLCAAPSNGCLYAMHWRFVPVKRGEPPAPTCPLREQCKRASITPLCSKRRSTPCSA